MDLVVCCYVVVLIGKSDYVTAKMLHHNILFQATRSNALNTFTDVSCMICQQQHT